MGNESIPSAISPGVDSHQTRCPAPALLPLQQPQFIDNVLPILQSCHTAIVDGYVVEGHVPVAEIRRLLAERPDTIGLAVP